MKCVFSILGLAAGLSLATVANATVITWSFGANPGFVTQGQAFTSSSLNETINVYSEQIHNYVLNSSTASNGVIVSGSSEDGGTTHPTIGSGSQALFQVNDSVNHEGIGIAPYNPVEGSSGGFANQDGITDAVKESTGASNSAYGNILEIELGSNIAQGTTLQFLLQAGIGAASDQVDVWYADAASPTNVDASTMTVCTTANCGINKTTPLGAISTDGTTPQFSITKNTSGTEFVAIVADCHYLLLDTITATTPGVPEPRFYGLLLAAFLGLAGIVYNKRRAAATTV
jgi:hypothetical protein